MRWRWKVNWCPMSESLFVCYHPYLFFWILWSYQLFDTELCSSWWWKTSRQQRLPSAFTAGFFGWSAVTYMTCSLERKFIFFLEYSDGHSGLDMVLHKLSFFCRSWFDFYANFNITNISEGNNLRNWWQTELLMRWKNKVTMVIKLVTKNEIVALFPIMWLMLLRVLRLDGDDRRLSILPQRQCKSHWSSIDY